LSDSDLSKLFTKFFEDWSKGDFPRERDLSDTIQSNFNKFFEKYPIPKEWRIDSSFDIGIKNNQFIPDKLQLKINGFGLIFLGIMAKAILDSLSSEFEGLLEGEIGNRVIEKKVKEIVSQHLSTNDKICSSCQRKNRYDANYCDQCKKEF
jgi:hypothetical protein